MDRESGRAYVDHEAEIVKARDETLGEFGLVVAVEMVRAKVAVNGTVAKHVVGGREHRGGHGQDRFLGAPAALRKRRSEEHTSELQSRSDIVCRLLLEKKNR